MFNDSRPNELSRRLVDDGVAEIIFKYFNLLIGVKDVPDGDDPNRLLRTLVCALESAELIERVALAKGERYTLLNRVNKLEKAVAAQKQAITDRRRLRVEAERAEFERQNRLNYKLKVK